MPSNNKKYWFKQFRRLLRPKQLVKPLSFTATDSNRLPSVGEPQPKEQTGSQNRAVNPPVSPDTHSPNLPRTYQKTDHQTLLLKYPILLLPLLIVLLAFFNISAAYAKEAPNTSLRRQKLYLARSTSPEDFLASGTKSQCKKHTNEVHLILRSNNPAGDSIIKKSWDAKALKIPKFAATETFAGTLFNRLGSLLKAIAENDAKTSSKNGLMKLVTDNREISRSEFFKKLARMEGIPVEKKVHPSILGNYIRDQGGLEIAKRVGARLPILQSFKRGLSFKLGLQPGTISNQGKTSRPPQKYGLILLDIIPPKTSKADGQASVASFTTEEIQHAAPAKVLWTIGPIVEKTTKPFSASYSESAFIQKRTSWESLSLPKASFKLNISPASKSLSTYLKGSKRGLILSLTQVENIYKMTYTTLQDSEKSGLIHTVQAPIYAGCEISAIFDAELRPTRTSISNMLGDKAATRINTTYTHQQQFYLLEASRSFAGHNISLSAERRLIQTSKQNPPTRYLSSYSRSF